MARTLLHPEILTPAQLELQPLLTSFSPSFGLVGGTAVALQIGHRRSIDFDLFTNRPFNSLAIRKKLRAHTRIERVFADRGDEYTILLKGVKVTFFHYPFPLAFTKRWGDMIRLGDLPTLAAMKAYALGRRAKWKDYVDLYFILSHFHDLTSIIRKARQIFGREFNEKNFRTQLAYFKDIDRSEQIIFMKGYAVADRVIERALINWSLQ